MGPYLELIRNAKQLMQALPDPICLVAPDERLIWENDAFRSRFRVIDPGNRVTEARRYRHHTTPILGEDDQIIAYTVTVREETTSVKQAVKPDLLEERYKIVSENTSDTIVLVDNQAVVRYVSPSLESLSGFRIEEYEGMDAFEIIHPEDQDRVRALFLEALQKKHVVEVEYRIFHAQGHLLFVEARVKPVLDQDGSVLYVVAVVRDMTARKKAEELLENILDNVNAAVLSTDKDFRQYTFCSESIEKISGISRQEIFYSPIRIHDHIHPDDNVILMGEVKRKLDLGMPVVQEFRFIHVENETRWGRLIIHPSIDHAGDIQRLDGIILDITEQKKSEYALEESEQRYKSLFEYNLDGVFSIDLKQFFIENANHAFEMITGIKLNQIPDRCLLGLIRDDDHNLVYEALFHVMQEGKPRDMECRLAFAKQEEKIVSITFVPIYLAGELNGIHGIVKDITKRKKEEMELIQSEVRAKKLQQSLNRFSADLANVMKVSDLEQRLIEEVKNVLLVLDVSLVEAPKGQEYAAGDEREIWIQIGEKQHPVYLRINTGRPLLKMEKEWLETAVHYVRILYDNLHLLEDLMKRMEEMVAKNKTPKWMLRLLFKLSEKERASLSSDLHDSVLQDLIIWYRKLETLRSSNEFASETEQELLQIEEGLLDAIHQIRITCNELRPPFLLKMGLVESLKSLFAYTRMFANYEIAFSAEQMEASLQEEQILGVYRIVQELLNNASKHAQASKVTMALRSTSDHIFFSYSDDGIGMNLTALEGSFQHMGIAGIEKRVMSLEGTVQFHSVPSQGFHVDIQFPQIMMMQG